MAVPVSKTAEQQLIERPTSLKDTAYREIKQLLLAGQLDRGRLYSAQHFAAMLGVSRTPVREALLQLTSEGFLVCFDVRGFKVREFTAKEIADVFETRAVIESHVFGKLAAEAGAAELRQLDQSLKVMRDCARRRDAQGFLDADKEFHLVAFRHAGNLHLLGILETIRSHMALFGHQALGHPGRYEEVLREHGAILQALKQQEPKKVLAALADHLATTQAYLTGNGTTP